MSGCVPITLLGSKSLGDNAYVQGFSLRGSDAAREIQGMSGSVSNTVPIHLFCLSLGSREDSGTTNRNCVNPALSPRSHIRDLDSLRPWEVRKCSLWRIVCSIAISHRPPRRSGPQHGRCFGKFKTIAAFHNMRHPAVNHDRQMSISTTPQKRLFLVGNDHH